MQKNEYYRSQGDKYISNIEDCKVFHTDKVDHFPDHDAIYRVCYCTRNHGSVRDFRDGILADWIKTKYIDHDPCDDHEGECYLYPTSDRQTEGNSAVVRKSKSDPVTPDLYVCIL